MVSSIRYQVSGIKLLGMHNFKDLVVWQKRIDLVVSIYEVTQKLPQSERHNLISQMQRSATSIPLNIAEGCGRETNPAFKQFLGHALGSSFELETQIIISTRLSYLNQDQSEILMQQLSSIQRMLNKLIRTL